jgi:hypothetical protein
MKIDVSKLREFFRRTGQVKEVSWDENTFIEKPKVKTIQPDKRLSFNDTFLNINKQLNK